MYQAGTSGGSSGGAGGGENNAGSGYGRSPMAETDARRGGGTGLETRREAPGLGKEAGDAVDSELLNKSLDAVRHRVKHYRMYLKPSFQVTKGPKRGGHRNGLKCFDGTYLTLGLEAMLSTYSGRTGVKDDGVTSARHQRGHRTNNNHMAGFRPESQAEDHPRAIPVGARKHEPKPHRARAGRYLPQVRRVHGTVGTCVPSITLCVAGRFRS